MSDPVPPAEFREPVIPYEDEQEPLFPVERPDPTQAPPHP